MLYPILKVLMMPLAALLYDTLGVGRLLLIQAVLSVLAALIENSIHVQEDRRDQEPLLSLKTWWRDVREAADYLRQERGLHGLYTYMAVTNGMAMGYAPLLIAFFRTAQGFTTAMYSFFSVAEFTGRTIGGVVRYRFSLPERKRFGFLFGVYQTYELMDACRNYADKTGRRLTFEYSLVGGVNDTKEDAEELIGLAAPLGSHVNLIPVNPIKERDFVQSNHAAIAAFQKRLEKGGVNVTIRREMGRDIDGACGQLRRRHMEEQSE